MASVFAAIRIERTALLQVIAGLDDRELERPNAVGVWSIKDVLAHLAGWQDWMLRAYPARLALGDVPDELRVTEGTIGTWNRRFVEERRTHTAQQVLDELDRGLHQLLAFAANLGTTRLNDPQPWPNATASVGGYLRTFVAGHDREHRRAIQAHLRALARQT